MSKFGRSIFSIVAVFVAVVCISATTEKVCNIRSSSCNESNNRQLQAWTTWKYNMLSCYNGNDFVWAYEWGPYDITLESGSNLNDNVLEMIFKAVNTFKITFMRQSNSDHYATSQLLMTNQGTQDSIKLTAERRLIDILQRVDRIDIDQGGKKLTFHNGAWKISFDRLPLGEPVPGQEWHGPLPLQGRTLSVVPNTYFINGHFEQLYNGPQFPLTVYISPSSENSVLVILRGINTFTYEISYQPADGWVTHIQPRGKSFIYGTPDQMAAEVKLTDILDHLQQLSFENEDLVQFITTNGNTRISFSTSNTQRSLTETNVIIPSTTILQDTFTSTPTHFLLKQEFLPNSPNSNNYQMVNVPLPVSMSAIKIGPGHLALTISGVNSRPFDIFYQEKDGIIIRVEPRATIFLEGNPELMDVETRMTDVILAARQIFVEPNGDLIIIGPSDNHRTIFTPAANRPFQSYSSRMLQLMPETYMKNGHFEQLSLGSNYLITVELTEYYSGLVEVTLRALNTLRWQIAYNSADGWVSHITPDYSSTLVTGPHELIDAERKIADIIGNVQQIAFEKDGMVQFIKDNAQTRVAFKNRNLYRRLEALLSSNSQPVTFLVDDSTYMNEGKLMPLFGSAPFPITLRAQHIKPGHLNVAIEAINHIPYDMYYDENTGLVGKIQVSSPGELISGTGDLFSAEKRVQDVLNNCNRIAYLSNGGIKFGTIDGGIAVNLVTRGEYGIKPETYFRNGHFEPLYTGPSFPIHVTLVQDNKGWAKATLRGINTLVYLIKFQTSDGWVLERMLIGTTHQFTTPQQKETENKLNEIFQNVQQLAFEKDGVLQFITNNGNTRVSFWGTSHDWWVQTPSRQLQSLYTNNIASYTNRGYPFLTESGLSVQPISVVSPTTVYSNRKNIIAGSYRKNGRSDPLFKGPEFPVYIVIQQALNDYVEVNLQAINTIIYGFQYKPQDGWVLSRTLLAQTHNSGSWELMAVEDELKYIFNNVQQIAFEKSGQIQFITDNTQTRISFM